MPKHKYSITLAVQTEKPLARDLCEEELHNPYELLPYLCNSDNVRSMAIESVVKEQEEEEEKDAP